MRVLVAAVLVAASPAVAFAHTADEQDAWLDEWARQASGGLTLELVEVLADFQDRHTPPPQRPVSSRPVNRPAGVEQWRPLVAEHFPARLVDEALSVMWCESRGNPAAKNGHSTAAGLFQFLEGTWNRVGAGWLGYGDYTSGDVYDPAKNIAAAAALVAHYEANGYWRWAAWTCQP